ncbi:Periplasmic aromatic aldehyde oxidoreductase, FAD binding subunit YagS [Pseudonocardia sp. Ae406_Ps2]|uniref:FAD binding domain-containing protein n=1 Tax=unclassified Pseudonocardia TaxID=2619320 RepID=UPI00094AE029|nr:MULTISPECIES: xanthine dehydrogenase family protein subunit M [unclassified Pseudonocardia]OLM01441.1 Periplasmic aromatic aldehyde oxidoreductase, FAD binding subunit YagS [Pseudonocardia sp. Ae406_Ps2]OLM06760.1 Periplasmic aromatic aldehyde oxidoreductase, FAD binding subunit YagS [Pseudonocardia sp. Ae331_Ps2]OLM23012.1 Periplasmic aromatic aldehyde oxidoreductase, FAD binding subunit YagS [Pseudonocardia sp. Ae706_Ps2]OLM32084.1 Periplasmic aromatic aldehyde oxidoreductase, FAD binding 
MRLYDFTRPGSVRAALTAAHENSAYLAGGTTLVDLMKLEVLAPSRVVDINRLPMRGIGVDAGGLHIGALERMSDVALDERVRTRYPMISQALELSASPQLRNMASMGGNLLQRTRCGYFRDLTTPCNKREPGSGCAALTGHNRMHAVLGTSESCVATHPSDVAVALVALDTQVHLEGRQGARTVALAEFYRLPGDSPQVENDLRDSELITGLTVPPLPWATRSTYVKIRDRQSYEFALTSVAVALDISGSRIRSARVAAGGIGTRPWRLGAVERALVGQPATLATYEAAAAPAADGARTLPHNVFKPALLRRTLVRALLALGGQS